MTVVQRQFVAIGSGSYGSDVQAFFDGFTKVCNLVEPSVERTYLCLEIGYALL